LIWDAGIRPGVYRASDEFEHEEWLTELEQVAEELGLDAAARSRAGDLLLSNMPEGDRSKRATMAACLYVGALATGHRPSQGDVADAAGVSRLAVQQRWNPLLEQIGLDAPSW
jgi:transcription initiation factor TFIIIB Brf1 subunit/transcription initiation factor TFIIB